MQRKAVNVEVSPEERRQLERLINGRVVPKHLAKTQHLDPSSID